jgi:hypothetical protein
MTTEFERISKDAKEEVERFIEKVNSPQFIEDLSRSYKTPPRFGSLMERTGTMCNLFLEMEILQLDLKENKQLLGRLKKTKMVIDAIERLAIYNRWVEPLEHKQMISKIVNEGREQHQQAQLLTYQCIGPLDPPPPVSNGNGLEEEEDDDNEVVMV